MSPVPTRADIRQLVHAHCLHHTHAAQLRAEGVDIAINSRLLGHPSLATTARHLDHIAPMAVVEAMRRQDWMASDAVPVQCCLATRAFAAPDLGHAHRGDRKDRILTC